MNFQESDRAVFGVAQQKEVSYLQQEEKKICVEKMEKQELALMITYEKILEEIYAKINDLMDKKENVK